LNFKNKKLLIEAFVMSILRYSCGIYGSTSPGLIERLQKLQNKAVKVLFTNGSVLKKRTTQIFKECNIFTIKQMIVYTILTQNYFNSNFKNPVSRNVRNNTKWLTEPTWRNSYGKRGLKYLIPATFNSLPSKLRFLSNINKVKRELKKWLLGQT
jgi:hypothetical protein